VESLQDLFERLQKTAAGRTAPAFRRNTVGTRFHCDMDAVVLVGYRKRPGTYCLLRRSGKSGYRLAPRVGPYDVRRALRSAAVTASLVLKRREPSITNDTSSMETSRHFCFALDGPVIIAGVRVRSSRTRCSWRGPL